MSYIWNPKKKDGLAHIATLRGSLCKMENNGRVIKAFTGWSEEKPVGRPLCKVCIAHQKANAAHHGMDRQYRQALDRDDGVNCSW